MAASDTHATVKADIRTALAAGDEKAARRAARRYVGGADPALAQDLIDEVMEEFDAQGEDRTRQQDAATAAYTDKLTTQRRAARDAEVAQPAAPVTRTRGRRAPVASPAAARRRAAADRDADAYTATRDEAPADPRPRPSTEQGSAHDYSRGAADHERRSDYRYNRDTGAEAAAAPAQAGRCLMPGCGIERTRADAARPDGLCTECRDGGLTRRDAAARAAGDNPLNWLRASYALITDGRTAATRDAAAHDRHALTDWVTANLGPELAADAADPAAIVAAAHAHGADPRAALIAAWHAAAAKGRARIAAWASEHAAELDTAPATAPATP